MPRGHGISTQPLGEAQQGVELDVAVAPQVRVWCEPSTALHHKVGKHPRPVLRDKIRLMQWDAQVPAYRLSILRSFRLDQNKAHREALSVLDYMFNGVIC